ncbi:hypothetical protein D3C76_1049750 [compost metagenome]
MAVAHTMALVDEVQVGIEVHDVDRPMPFEGLDHRRMDRVVTAQHHRHGAGLENLAHGRLDVGIAAGHVGVHDIGVTDIDHAQLVIGQVGGVIFEVVGAGMAEREQGRCLANAARSETCARAPLGAHVVGRTEDRHIGVDGIPVGADGRFGEGAMPDEGQVQAAGFITVLCHVQVSPLIVLVRRRGDCSTAVAATMAAGQQRKNAQVQMHTSGNPKYSPECQRPAGISRRQALQ